MAEVEDLEVHILKHHNAEESLEDKDSDIFDTILLNDSAEDVKSKLKTLKEQGIDTHGVLCSYLFYFSIEQTPNCQEFIKWCVNNYAPTLLPRV